MRDGAPRQVAHATTPGLAVVCCARGGRSLLALALLSIPTPSLLTSLPEGERKQLPPFSLREKGRG